MVTTTTGYALSVGDFGQLDMTLLDPASERLLHSRLQQPGAQVIPVRISAMEDFDVEGHGMTASLKSVWVRAYLDENDTEGHAIGVHFPTATDAEHFRRRALAAGVLVGSIALASAGAVGLANLPRSADLAPQAPQAPAVEHVAGRGLTPGLVDIPGVAPAAAAATTQLTGLDAETGQPVRTGLQQGVDMGAVTITAPAPAGPVERPEGKGPLEKADSGTPSVTAPAPAGPVDRPEGRGPLEGAD